MSDFIKRKIEIIKNESAALQRPVYIVIFNKFFRKALGVPVLALNIFLALVFFPIILLVTLLINLLTGQKKKHAVFFIGLEHVIDKSAERGDWFEKRGFKSLFFSGEATSHKASERYKPEVFKYSGFLLWDLVFFAFSYLKSQPAYVEVYFEGDMLRQFLCAALARLNGSLVISIERGQLLYLLNHAMTPYTKFFLFNTYRASNYVFYREPYMMEFFENENIKQEKLYFDHNKVPVRNEPDFIKEGFQYNVLFLNSFVQPRRADIFIAAMPEVARAVPQARFFLVGGRNDLEIKAVQKQISELGLQGLVTVQGWTTNAQQHFDSAAIFVLPADQIFCNFSLLEAMERGLPAIIANVRDADRIVDHGINGFLCEQEPGDFAKHIILLLQNQDLRIKMAQAAREKVKSTFDSEKRMDPILSLIFERVHLAEPVS